MASSLVNIPEISFDRPGFLQLPQFVDPFILPQESEQLPLPEEVRRSPTPTPPQEEPVPEAVDYEEDEEGDEPVDMKLHVPTHPIPSMQGAFAESMREAAGLPMPRPPKKKNVDSATRRKVLLEQDVDHTTHASRWQQQKESGQEFHQLWKLLSQIAFGTYLLLEGIAKDDEQVLTILQGHVDEVDEFLETTLEDFNLAQDDIDDRLKHLKTPLENIDIFDGMLEDRQFRLQIVTGNERIEHIIARTAAAMNDALKDVKQGLDATQEFAIYLAEKKEEDSWKLERPDMITVFQAMKGNAEGWYSAYLSLESKGTDLGAAMGQLGAIVAEMDRRAGEISRKTRFSLSSKTSLSPVTFPSSTSPTSMVRSRPSIRSITKVLPQDPTTVRSSIRDSLPAIKYDSVDEESPEPEIHQEPSPKPESVHELPCHSVHELPASEPEARHELPGRELGHELSGHELSHELPAFTLQPRTYSPTLKPRTYSPAPPKARTPSPRTLKRDRNPLAAEIPRRSSLRQRFSLRKKEVIPPPTSTPNVFRKPEITPASPTNSVSSRKLGSLSTPLTHGPDSAYSSGTENPLSFHAPSVRALSPGPRLQFTSAIPENRPVSAPRPQNNDLRAGSPFISSPRSDQQHFRPVNASPNSPLQRPWTAGPQQPESSLRNSPGVLLSSKLSMSNMTMATENGRKVKKKRSAIGSWFKKTFSLSEEEKASFEQRRRAQAPERDTYGRGRSPPQFLDGKRIR